MSEYKLPALSADGSIDDPNSMIIRMYLYFATSEKSQTFFYDGHVQSLKYILANNDDDEQVKDSIVESLIAMYNRYFSDTEVTVSIETSTDDNIKLVDINVTTYDDGNKLTLSQSIQLENDTIQYLDDNILDLYKGR